MFCSYFILFLTRLVLRNGGGTFIRRVTGVEAMRFIGWDLQHWRGDIYPATPTDVLCSMAGNAWSSWHFIPFWTAILCGLEWQSIMETDKTLKEELAKGSEDEEDSYSEDLGSDGEEAEDE